MATVRLIRADDLVPADVSGAMRRAAGVSPDLSDARGIWMGISTLAPGSRSAAHVHTNCETALYVLRGTGHFLVGDGLQEELRFRTGDFLYIPPGAPHQPVNDGAEPVELLVARNAAEELSVDYAPSPFGRPDPEAAGDPTGTGTVVGFDSVVLFVADLERSRAFYRQVLGIDPVNQSPHVASFDVRNAQLLLHADAEDSPRTPRGVGAHLHLRVHGIHGLWHRLRSEGLAPPAAPAERPWEVVAFSLTDPDGYLLEFVEPA